MSSGRQRTAMDLKHAWWFALGNVYLGCQGHDWVAIHYLPCVPTASLPVLGLAYPPSNLGKQKRTLMGGE